MPTARVAVCERVESALTHSQVGECEATRNAKWRRLTCLFWAILSFTENLRCGRCFQDFRDYITQAVVVNMFITWPGHAFPRNQLRDNDLRLSVRINSNFRAYSDLAQLQLWWIFNKQTSNINSDREVCAWRNTMPRTKQTLSTVCDGILLIFVASGFRRSFTYCASGVNIEIVEGRERPTEFAPWASSIHSSFRDDLASFFLLWMQLTEFSST